jgi:alpha-tubulin suppressor-like RCC1 family protein
MALATVLVGAACTPPVSTAPIVHIPRNLTVAAETPSGTSIRWSVTGYDATGTTPVPVDCTRTPGVFPVGTTLVSCTASRGGAATTRSFSVTVEPYVPSAVVAITAGNAHSCALLTNGSVRCWGSNRYGQLGDGTTMGSTTPVTVVNLSGAIAITTGSGIQRYGGNAWDNNTTCALLVGGTVRCWGQRARFISADIDLGHSSYPMEVGGLAGAVHISGPCALMGDGTGQCWQTVNNLGVEPMLGGALELMEGRSQNCAIFAGGTVRCWGFSRYGELGDGSTANGGSTSTWYQPAEVTGLTGAIALSGTDDFRCALLDDGTARCWGRNASGNLGDGTTVDAATPVTVTALTDAVAITAGYSHACALVADGTARCWGDNASGSLGDGTTVDAATPVTVTGLTAGVALSTGDSHSCALGAGGAVRCWGSNHHGQLGDGTSDDRSTPVTVIGLP